MNSIIPQVYKFNIVFLIGKVGSGKGTFIDILEKKYNFKVFNYADSLKDILWYAGWDGEKDLRGRKLLQDVGKAFRKYDDCHWVYKAYDIIVSEINLVKSQNKKSVTYNCTKEELAPICYTLNICLGDVRHLNEYTTMLGALKAMYPEDIFNAVTIKIIGPNHDEAREMDQETLKDISEIGMDDFTADYTLLNHGTLEEFNSLAIETIETILRN